MMLRSRILPSIDNWYVCFAYMSQFLLELYTYILYFLESFNKTFGNSKKG
jgi:hypothetical protein